jgi:hypothetical protein
VRRLAVLLLVLGTAAPARADRDAAPGGDQATPPVGNRVNLRIGGASTDHNGRPTVCLEIGLIAAATLEACGTGSGILHTADGGEMAHFRAEWRLLRVAAAAGTGQVQLGAGFAELEVGDDRPGFQFGSPGADRAAVAGPEAALSVGWLRDLGRGIDVIANLTVGAAWFAGADQLSVPRDHWQPFASLEVGLGW